MRDKFGRFVKGHSQYNTGKTWFKKGHPPTKGCFKKRENHFNWKGGEHRTKLGYIYVLKPKHPFCNIHGRVVRSRLVMEKYLGRYLTPEEPVHHINGICDDDRPENLMAFISNSAHQRFGQKGQFKSNNKVKPSEIIFDGRYF